MYSQLYSCNIKNTHVRVLKNNKWEGQPDIEKFLIRVIIKFVKEEINKIGRFSIINFILEDEMSSGQRNAYAFTNHNEVNEESATIHILVDSITSRGLNVHKILKTLRHELSHDIFFVLNKEYKHIEGEAFSKLKGLLAENTKNFELTKELLEREGVSRNYRAFWSIIRQELFLTIRMAQIEGIAEFASMESKLPWNHHTLKGFYNRALRTSKTDILILLNIMNKFPRINIPEGRFISNFKSLAYDSGPHMVYTILWVYKNDLELEHLMKMQPFQFIETYEKACHHIGFKPIISISSGRGYLDYNNFLHKWWNLLSKYNN